MATWIHLRNVAKKTVTKSQYVEKMEGDEETGVLEVETKSLESLDELQAGTMIDVHRQTPLILQGYVGTILVPESGVSELEAAIQQTWGGGEYLIRAKKKAPNGRIVFIQGSASVRISGNPRDGSKEYVNGMWRDMEQPKSAQLPTPEHRAYSQQSQDPAKSTLDMVTALLPHMRQSDNVDLAGLITAIASLQGHGPAAAPQKDPFSEAERALSLARALSDNSNHGAHSYSDEPMSMEQMMPMLMMKFMMGNQPQQPQYPPYGLYPQQYGYGMQGYGQGAGWGGPMPGQTPFGAPNWPQGPQNWGGGAPNWPQGPQNWSQNAPAGGPAAQGGQDQFSRQQNSASAGRHATPSNASGVNSSSSDSGFNSTNGEASAHTEDQAHDPESETVEFDPADLTPEDIADKFASLPEAEREQFTGQVLKLLGVEDQLFSKFFEAGGGPPGFNLNLPKT